MARTGLSTNEVEIDKQFLELRGTLVDAQSTTSGTQAASISSGAGALSGQITGVRIDKSIIGGFGVKWNQPNPQPTYVEVQVCTDLTFISSKTQSFRTGGLSNSFVFGFGVPDVVYFVRLRANYAGNNGPWSAVFNSETGKAVSANIIDGAASSRIRVDYTSFSPSLLGYDGITWPNDYEATYGHTQVVTHGQIVLVFAVIEFNWRLPTLDFPTVPATYIDIDLLEDGESIFTYRNAKTVEAWTDSVTGYTVGTSTLPFVAIPSTPVAGNHEYSVQIRVSTDGSVHNGTAILYVEPLRIVMAFVELIR